MLKQMMAGIVAAGLVGVAGTAYAGKDLDAIKARGQLLCGVSTGVAGFAAADSQGKWTGIDVDVCRAVAAAIFEVGAGQISWAEELVTNALTEAGRTGLDVRYHRDLRGIRRVLEVRVGYPAG